MSTPGSKLWEWWRVNGAAVSPIVAAFTVISGGTYWIGTVHSNLAKDLAHERELREQQVAKERELRDSEVRALRSQLKMQQETAKKMMDDAVQAKLFQIQNVQEYAGHSISKHPAPSSG
jgi:hypothetical protein